MKREMVILGYRESRPIVLAEPRPDFPSGWRFYCAYCRRWHLHGEDLGHRVAHCSALDSPFRKTGYFLACAAESGGEVLVHA